MVDLLGPADAGATATLTTTGDVSDPVAGDSWYGDCADGVDGSGTPIVSKYLNRMLQQQRAAIRFSGVPQANAYDYMLSWAMQSGFANWLQSGFGGAVNALTGAAPNAPQQVEGGTLVCGIVETATNTGAVTFNWSGVTSGAAVNRIDGSACTGGEVQYLSFLALRWDGGAWRIVSPLTPAQLATAVQDGSPFLITGPGAVIIADSNVTLDKPILALGVGATWTFESAGYSVLSAGGGIFSAADSRWPSSAPPGTWTVTQITLDSSADYGAGGNAAGTTAVLVRTE